MALDQSALLEVLDALKAADVGDRVRQAAETVYQALIEAELTDTIGAALHERSEHRTALRNGHRTRVLSTTAGDLELRIPKLRTGSFFPSLLERRRRVDQAVGRTRTTRVRTPAGIGQFVEAFVVSNRPFLPVTPSTKVGSVAYLISQNRSNSAATCSSTDRPKIGVPASRAPRSALTWRRSCGWNRAGCSHRSGLAGG